MKNLLFYLFLLLPNFILSQEIRRYEVPSSRQGVAVDDHHFYVINNASITKHRKTNGELILQWKDITGAIEHLNSGIIIDDKLYCANSNYPKSPMASSIEIFNPNDLSHIGNHSFGIMNGSATWIDRFENYWYVAFAHYTGRGGTEAKTNAWTRLVKFDTEWRQIESWIFPEELITQFGTRSNSGGVIHRGVIYVTGHDLKKLYQLEFPRMGYKLKWVGTYPVANEGQGIAIEVVEDKKLIYGIIKDEKVVVVSLLD
ncbi:MAG: hypothetical protein AAF693_01055 [Bacteroidota bacterium]